MDVLQKKRLLTIVYIATMLYALHNFTIYFIFSDFLNQYFSKITLSIIFAFGAALSIIISNYFGDILKRNTNFKTLSTVLIIQFIVTIMLSMSQIVNMYLIFILAILYIILSTIIWISINIFIEEFSDHENIGAIRGTVLTVYNFQAIIAPFITAQFFNLIGYTGLFLISSITLIPLMFITKKFFSHIKEPKYKHINLIDSFKLVWKNKDIRGVIASSFAINSFYAAINIYLILYLTKMLEMPIFLYIGIITPISMIPFILIPYELGKYSDEIFGEKRAMLFGIFLMSIATMSIYIFNIESTNIFLWIAILFIARLGASIAETENYSYFYKKIDGRSAGLIALFQNMFNIGFIFISIIGFIILSFFSDIKIIFLISGLVGILSIYAIMKIHDIKGKSDNIEAKDKSIETDLYIKEKIDNEL